MPERSADWLSQAQRDLERARLDVQHGYFEWACFTSQQAAEKAVKAVHYFGNRSVRGHGILKLLHPLVEDLPDSERLLHAARILDRYYIEARYPNGFPAGKPADYFDLSLAKEAVDAAEIIIGFALQRISRDHCD
ncbi:MAG: HEPN domain-containing protein [Deltaproteobacteria bacterium]